MYDLVHSVEDYFVRGLPGTLALSRLADDNQGVAATPAGLGVQVYDLGTQCNIPITPDQLRSPGTSLVVDASDDDAALFKSMGNCIKWWLAHYHFVVQHEPATELTWSGLVVTLPAPDSPLCPFVRVYKVYDEHLQPTGRRAILSIAMGRMTAEGTIVDPAESGKPLSIMKGLQPRVFKRAEFDLFNTEVRRFYRAVLNAIGLGGGTYDL